MGEIIRIFYGCEVQIEKSVRGSLFLSAPSNHDRFFFLHTFWTPAFDFNVGVAINESHFYTLTSAILKIDVMYDVTMTSTPNVLTTKLRDLLYNQCIDYTCCYSFFIYPTGRIRVCKIRFVSTGENRGNPCQVCKKRISIPSENLGDNYTFCCTPLFLSLISFTEMFQESVFYHDTVSEP